MEITIRKLDNDDPAHTQVMVSSHSHAAQQDSYIEDREWLEFGRALQSFPQTVEHVVVFANGSPDPSHYCFIELRAYVYDSVGHTALRVQMDDHGNDPYRASAAFSIRTEAATLNRLGSLLERWALSGGAVFGFSFDNK